MRVWRGQLSTVALVLGGVTLAMTASVVSHDRNADAVLGGATSVRLDTSFAGDGSLEFGGWTNLVDVLLVGATSTR